MSNLVSVTYDVCPGLENPEDFDFEMPDEKKIWNARSADEWWQLLSTRAVFVDIVGANQKQVPEQEKAYDLTAFGALVVAHVVCIHMWACLRLTQAFGAISPMGSTPLSSTNPMLRWLVATSR